MQARVILKILSLGHSKTVVAKLGRNLFCEVGGPDVESRATETPQGLDYKYCTYDGCRLNFRGPAAALDQPYIAVLGGTEVFGRFVEHPFTEQLSEWAGLPVANLGVAQAGLSLYSEEPWLLDAASHAEVTVLQVLGAQNMSNRLYSVHSRRNDRFLSVSPELRDMFPKVDFADINFTGHLIEELSRDVIAFQRLVDELKWAWLQRIRRILSVIRGDVILLWMSDRRPDEGGISRHASEPLFVDRLMLDELVGEVAGIVEVVTDKSSQKLGEMILSESEEEAALCLPGPQDHIRAAEAIAKMIGNLRDAGPLKAQARV